MPPRWWSTRLRAKFRQELNRAVHTARQKDKTKRQNQKSI
jgi:hypothetical protein